MLCYPSRLIKTYSNQLKKKLSKYYFFKNRASRPSTPGKDVHALLKMHGNNELVIEERTLAEARYWVDSQDKMAKRERKRERARKLRVRVS